LRNPDCIPVYGPSVHLSRSRGSRRSLDSLRSPDGQWRDPVGGPAGAAGVRAGPGAPAGPDPRGGSPFTRIQFGTTHRPGPGWTALPPARCDDPVRLATRLAAGDAWSGLVLRAERTQFRGGAGGSATDQRAGRAAELNSAEGGFRPRWIPLHPCAVP